MLVYAVTIFLSAFLLFEVQPMIGKIILPWFGGAAAVWSTCLLFFQAALLAGYLYAHCSTRYLKPRHQAFLHVGLMAVSLALLPIIPSPTWKPVQAGRSFHADTRAADGDHRVALRPAIDDQPFAAGLVCGGQAGRGSVSLVRSFEPRVAAGVVYFSSAGGTPARDPHAGRELVGCLRRICGGVRGGGMDYASSRGFET